MSGYWVISWPAYEPTGRPGDSLVATPAASWIMRGWEPTPQDIHDLEAGGATLRYAEAPPHYTLPPPGSDAPTIRSSWGGLVWDQEPDPEPVPEPDWDAIQFEHEHSSEDDGKEIEISVPYEDEEGNAKTLTLTYTYEYVKMAATIGGGTPEILFFGGGNDQWMSPSGDFLRAANIDLSAFGNRYAIRNTHSGMLYINGAGDDWYQINKDDSVEFAFNISNFSNTNRNGSVLYGISSPSSGYVQVDTYSRSGDLINTEQVFTDGRPLFVTAQGTFMYKDGLNLIHIDYWSVDLAHEVGADYFVGPQISKAGNVVCMVEKDSTNNWHLSLLDNSGNIVFLHNNLFCKTGVHFGVVFFDHEEYIYVAVSESECA